PEILAEGDVGGREAELAAAPVARLDASLDLPVAAEKLGGLGGTAGDQELADAGRRISLAVRALLGRDHGHAEAVARGQLAEHRDVAAALVAEHEVLADHDVAGAHPLDQEPTHEVLGRDGGEFGIEMER